MFCLCSANLYSSGNTSLVYSLRLIHGREVQFSQQPSTFVFQGWDDPYVPRTHEGLLKWKYANMNSVDFLFEVAHSNS